MAYRTALVFTCNTEGSDDSRHASMLLALYLVSPWLFHLFSFSSRCWWSDGCIHPGLTTFLDSFWTPSFSFLMFPVCCSCFAASFHFLILGPRPRLLPLAEALSTSGCLPALVSSAASARLLLVSRLAVHTSLHWWSCSTPIPPSVSLAEQQIFCVQLGVKEAALHAGFQPLLNVRSQRFLLNPENSQ